MSNYWKAQKREGVKEIFPSMATVQKPGGGRFIKPGSLKGQKTVSHVKANPEIFKQGKAFKEGLGKFGFNKPSGKK